MMNNKIVRAFLDVFFLMLEEYIISYGQIDNKVFGIVTGIKSDINEFWQHQNFYWLINKNEQELSDLIILCQFLIEYKLIDGDKILIPEDNLLKRINGLGWDDDKSQKVVDDLFSIEIKMIDEGEETDSFFLHL